MINEPIAGAARGAILLTVPINENILAASLPWNKSLTTAFAFTTTKPPKNASKNLNIHNSYTDELKIIKKLKN